jgi:ribose 1,5-bisphosphokinase PhnN
MTRPILIVIGPSASGKSTVVRELARRGVVRVHPTWTTRPRRADEQHGEIEHRFVDDASFERLDECGFFLGTVTLPGLPYRYGLPRPQTRGAGPIDTVMARAPFVELFAPHFPERLVFQIEDTPERARARLLDRNCTPTELDARLGFYIAEARAGRAVADRVFRNDGPLDELIDAFEDALRARVAA